MESNFGPSPNDVRDFVAFVRPLKDAIISHVTHFARGFADIVTDEEIQKRCFKSLELEDLDGMLHGSESDVSVDDWKAHTEYNGYKDTDPHIYWFWKELRGL
ncbi:hypothetical protein Lser_V15G41183 [Lactuca serriola]